MFHEAVHDSSCPVILPFSKLMPGAGTDLPDCGSVASVEMPKAMALNGVGATMAPARALPEASNAGEGFGWNRPVTSPPAVPPPSSEPRRLHAGQDAFSDPRQLQEE